MLKVIKVLQRYCIARKKIQAAVVPTVYKIALMKIRGSRSKALNEIKYHRSLELKDGSAGIRAINLEYRTLPVCAWHNRLCKSTPCFLRGVCSIEQTCITRSIVLWRLTQRFCTQTGLIFHSRCIRYRLQQSYLIAFGSRRHVCHQFSGPRETESVLLA